MNTGICLHTAEVAGSIPASPTLKISCFADKTQVKKSTLNARRDPCAATMQQRGVGLRS